MPKCFKCNLVVSGLNGMQLHLKRSHQLDQYSGVFKCGEDKCFYTCSSWTILRRHLKSFHKFLPHDNSDMPKNVLKPTPCDNESVASNNPNDPGLDDVETDNVETDNVNTILDLPDMCTIKTDIETFASQFITKVYAKPGQPRSMVQEFINDTTDFLSASVSSITSVVKSKLEACNIPGDVVNDICENISTLSDPFKGFSSEYFRFKFLKENGYYIEPEEFKITSDILIKKVGDKMTVQLDHLKGVIVSMRKVLKAFLELPNVFNIVMASLQESAPNGIISDYIHGPHWRAKLRFFKDKIVIPLHLFFDDYEVYKEIGNHSAKLGGVYYKIASLPQEFQGSVENIFVAMLFSAQDRADYGNKCVFKKLIKELNYLQRTGIQVNVGNERVQVFFTLGLFIADNLAMHQMLGFVEGFSGNYPCRFCKVYKFNMHFQSFEDPTLLRDKVQHAIDCSLKNVTATGVNDFSVLEDLDHFDATENPSIDEMHDIFEGSCVYGLQHCLYHLCFVKEYFSVDVLNFRILALDYGASISNKPPQFSETSIKTKSIKMTANEMKTFVRTLSLLVGDLVDLSDPVWQFYLILRDIIDIVLSRQIQEEVLTTLALKIAEHHRLYVELFNDTLKPKHHIMVHYPSIMRLSGCPPNFACDRFEAKHQPSVKDAKGTTSRRNIAWTLLVKEQLRFAHRLLMRKGLCTVLDVGPDDTSYFDSALSLPESFQNDSGDILHPKHVTYKGTKYVKGSCVVLDSDNDGGPKFGVVLNLFLDASSKVCVECNILKVLSYSTHFHAYCVEPSSVSFSVMLDSILDYHPVLLCTAFNGKKYVTLHHAL